MAAIKLEFASVYEGLWGVLRSSSKYLMQSKWDAEMDTAISALRLPAANSVP
jgi:hypothetical protein